MLLALVTGARAIGHTQRATSISWMLLLAGAAVAMGDILMRLIANAELITAWSEGFQIAAGTS